MSDTSLTWDQISTDPAFTALPPDQQAHLKQQYVSEFGKERITQAAKDYGVPVDLAHKIAHTESSMNPNAVSPKGALGLFQLMPDTAKTLGVDPTHPDQNIRGGLQYFSQQLKKFGGDVAKALAAYNAGPSHVEALIQKYGTGWQRHLFPETKDDLKRILHLQPEASPQPSSGSAFNTPPTLPPSRNADLLQFISTIQPPSSPTSLPSSELAGPPRQEMPNPGPFTGPIPQNPTLPPLFDKIKRYLLPPSSPVLPPSVTSL
jgi:hypothetical protein